MIKWVRCGEFQCMLSLIACNYYLVDLRTRLFSCSCNCNNIVRTSVFGSFFLFGISLCTFYFCCYCCCAFCCRFLAHSPRVCVRVLCIFLRLLFVWAVSLLIALHFDKHAFVRHAFSFDKRPNIENDACNGAAVAASTLDTNTHKVTCTIIVQKKDKGNTRMQNSAHTWSVLRDTMRASEWTTGQMNKWEQ